MEKEMYIDLLKKALIDYHRVDSLEYKPLYSEGLNWKYKLLMSIDKYFRGKGYAICKVFDYNLEDRIGGLDHPNYADTMIGLKRLNNIEYCVKQIIKDNIEGDLIETGVWRGGATIFMNALLKVYDIKDKIVWAADSFEGLPKPDVEKYEADEGDTHYLREELAISLDTVKNNFKKYDLLNEQVKFLKGWFKDTLPTAPITKLSLVRLDGDMYESTMDGLVNLYPKLSKGGFIIIDDWGAVDACKQAVIDYREKHGINDKIETIDTLSVYWRKS